MPDPRDGCVANFDHGDRRLTVWKSGARFRLEEFGLGGAILPLTYDPLFQSLAAELHRMACEIGRLKRRELDREIKGEDRACF